LFIIRPHLHIRKILFLEKKGELPVIKPKTDSINLFQIVNSRWCQLSS
jgi:hypothetical protein